MSEAIVVKEGLLTGKIGSEGTLSGSVVSEGALSGSLAMSIDYEDYPGPYKVTSEGTLTGKIGSEGTLSGSIVSEGVLSGSLSMPVGYEDYTGPYEVTPKVESQSLGTADKRMAHDKSYSVSPESDLTLYTKATKVGSGVYLKRSGAYSEASSVYKKQNGVWVTIDKSSIDQTKKYELIQ